MSGTTPTSTSRRSSTNRSIRTVSRQPPWRSSSLSNKNSPTASLSIIVAEPEQGAPLKSAGDSVAPLASSSAENKESNIGSISERNHTWFSSLTRNRGKDIVKRSTISDQPAPSTSLPPYSQIPLAKSPPLSIPVPSVDNTTAPFTNSPQLSVPESHDQSQTRLSPSSSYSSSGSPPPFASAVPRTPPSITPIYVGSPQSSTIIATLPVSNSPSEPTAANESILSIPPTHNRTSTSKSPSLEPMTAQNPTSSRFTLSIPLLGRAKVPLDSVLAESRNRELSDKVPQPSILKGDPSRDSGPQVPMSAPSTLSSSSLLVPPSTSVSTQLTCPNQSVESDTTVTSAANIPQDNPSEVEITPSTTARSTTTGQIRPNKPNESTSWWNYVGWTPTSTSTPTGGPDRELNVTSTEIGNANVHLTMSAGSGSAESGFIEEGQSAEPAIEPKRIHSAQPVSISSSPTWSSPWGWYFSTNGTTSKDIQVDVAMAQEPGPDPLMVSSETPEISPKEGALVLAHPPIPITTSMQANWGGWASFFSSRTFMVKTLGYRSAVGRGIEDVKRDEDGMEVMDIDDDNDDEPKDGPEKYSGRMDGQVSSSPGATSQVITNTTPLLLKPSNSRDSHSSRFELESAGNKGEHKPSSSPAKYSISSTPKMNSGSNTPLPPLSPSPSPSSREKNQNQSLPNTPTTSMSAKTESTTSPAPSKKSMSPPNLVLPTWQQTFHTAPRNVVPVTVQPQDDQSVGGKLLGKTMRFVSEVLFARETQDASSESGKGKERETGDNVDRELKKREEEKFNDFGKELPKSWAIIEEAGLKDITPTTSFSHIPSFGFCSPDPTKRGVVPVTSEDGGSHSEMKDVLRGCKTVVVIGIHGWFPGAMIRTVVGEPTGTSTKFTNMTEQALQQFENEHGVKLEKITKIPLEGEGIINTRVERLYNTLITNEDWMKDLHEADAIIVSTHSQGSIVSTHLLNRLIQDNHITTARNRHLTTTVGTGAETFPSAIGVPENIPGKVQRVCCLALCGIHLGPLRYLSSSTLVGPYIQYFESTAARELFEFQNTESAVSKAYVKALRNVLDHGIKMLYIASLNDQVVPIYSGLFTAVSHPLILRALYIDGDAYHSSDFLSNLLVLLLRVLNSGISDSGLIGHLSEATAGSLIGVGHSTAYEELTTFSLAVKYLFLANEGTSELTELHVEPFNASQEQNDYEIPWSLRDIIADERVLHFFSHDIAELRDAFREWHPRTSILRDLKRKLQPITRLPNFNTFKPWGSSSSKL